MSAVRGRVFAVEYLGTNQIVTIDIERAEVKARLPSREGGKVGESVGVAFQPKARRFRRGDRASDAERAIRGGGHG